MNKILSVSVAAYNVEECIGKCLDSLVKNKVVDDIEIIVVDDGSTDATWDIIQKYKLKYPTSIIAVQKENGGHGSTINVSIQKASAKYFKIVDADDWVDMAGIEKLINFLKNTNVDMILNPYFTVHNSEQKLEIPYNEVKPEIPYQFEDVFKLIKMPMHGVTFKTDIVKRMGPIIDEKCFYVDTEYIMYPLPFVNKVICLDFPIYYYLLGNINQSVSLINMVKRRSQRERVIKSLVRYYNVFEQKMSKEKNSYYIRTLQGVIGAHYKYFMYLEDKTVFEEIKKFDNWLKKNTNEDVYSGLKESLIMKYIRIQRKTSFAFIKPSYFIIHNILKIFKFPE